MEYYLEMSKISKEKQKFPQINYTIKQSRVELDVNKWN
jgi:hypothetical protein